MFCERYSLRRVEFHAEILQRLERDQQLLRFFEGSSPKVPKFYLGRMRNALGPLWAALPQSAIDHDPNAFRKDPAGYGAPNQKRRDVRGPGAVLAPATALP